MAKTIKLCEAQNKMKIGIIVYSKTNHTLSVAKKLSEALATETHDVEILPITVKNENPTTGEQIILDKAPDPKAFEMIILGSPVWAFSLCPVMKKYLSTLHSLSGKDTYCFVTHHFPFPSFGGNRSVRSLKKLCIDKHANVKKTGVISWSSKKRDLQIERLVNDFITMEKGLTEK